MSIKPQDMGRVMTTDAATIFAIIVDQFGVRMADEIAKEVLKPRASRPTVV